jgi:hypothetical protein
MQTQATAVQLNPCLQDCVTADQALIECAIRTKAYLWTDIAWRGSAVNEPCTGNLAVEVGVGHVTWQAHKVEVRAVQAVVQLLDRGSELVGAVDVPERGERAGVQASGAAAAAVEGAARSTCGHRSNTVGFGSSCLPVNGSVCNPWLGRIRFAARIQCRSESSKASSVIYMYQLLSLPTSILVHRVP